MFLIKNKTLAIILILDKFFLQIRHLYFKNYEIILLNI